jgi:PEGA domain-containing protein
MIRPEGGSWSGARDNFGERATAVDANGRSVDLLRLFATFTPASQALADRIERLNVDRPAVGRAVALDRDEPSSRLILISEHVPGVRLSELLQAAVERSVVADLGAALFVMRRLLTLAESLESATGVAQFSIAPERIVITPHGRVVIVEPVLAAAAQTGATRSTDIAGIAIAGMSIMLGHLIKDAEHIDPLSPVLQDAADVAAIRAGDRFSTALRLWFDRAIIADPTLSFPGFRQARLALSRVGRPRESGCDASRRALKVFLDDLAIERLTDIEDAALEVDRLREIRAKQRARWKAISAPDEEWISVEDEVLIGDDAGISEEMQDAVVPLSDDRADEAIGIGALAGPEMAAPVEEPIEASSLEEPIEVSSLEETIEAEPLEEPIETPRVEESLEAALVEELIEAAPPEEPVEAPPLQEAFDARVEESLEAALVEELIEAASLEEPIEAPPLEEAFDARVEESLEAALVEELIEAAPPEEPIEAPPLQEPVDARVEESLEVAPVEELIEAASLEEPIEAPPLQEPIEAAPVGELIETPEEELIEAAPAPPRSWLRSMARQLGLASPEPRPLQSDLDAREDVPLESPPAEQTTETTTGLAGADLEIGAESSIVSIEPLIEEASTEAAHVGDEGLAEVDEEPIEIASPQPPVETIEERLAEQADAFAVDRLDQSPQMLDPEIETQEERPAELTQDMAAFSAEEYESAPSDSGAAEESEVLDRPTASLPETVAAESWSEWTDPALEEPIARRVDDGEGRPADGRENETTGVEAELPAETLEEWLIEEADAVTVDAPIDVEADAEPDILEQPAASLAEPSAAESSHGWSDPTWEEAFTAKVEDGDGLREAVEGEPTEAAESERPVETVDAPPLEESQPIASVDASIAAALSEDAHKSWIQSITEQLGRIRRREADLLEPPAEATAATDAPLVDHTEALASGEPRETVEETEILFGEDADARAVEAAPIQLERATIPHVEAPTDRPAAWVRPEPAPWHDDTAEAGKAMPFPPAAVAYEWTPHRGVPDEQAAHAEPRKPDAQPARGTPSPRTIVVPPREWKRAAATILIAGLALVIVAALAIAGRSYYTRMRTPGTIAVDSTPRGSEVLIDGAIRGVTPLTVTLKPGDYVLELRRNAITRRFPIAVTPGAQLAQQLDWSTVRATGTLAISSTPSQAKVTVDGKERGVTPLTVSDVPVGMRRVVIESSAGTVRRDVRVVADSQVTINETIISGWIAAFGPFELQIFEGTRLLGTTESGRIMVRAGRHELDFVNTRLGFRERRGVDVNPGTTTAVNIDTVAGIVRITAPAGADVSIDGMPFGETPLPELRLPIGTHEIVLRHPQLGERRVSVTVGASAPTEVNVDFSKR